jgi:hypothetical protein
MSSYLDCATAIALFGFDSLIAGLMIGPALPSWRDRVLLVLLFGVCDGAATLLDAEVPHFFPEPPAVVLYLLAVALVILGLRRTRGWLYATPVLFSIDNLAAGSAASDAPGLALSSAAMAAAGLALGGLRSARVGRSWRSARPA